MSIAAKCFLQPASAAHDFGVLSRRKLPTQTLAISRPITVKWHRCGRSKISKFSSMTSFTGQLSLRGNSQFVKRVGLQTCSLLHGVGIVRRSVVNAQDRTPFNHACVKTLLHLLQKSVTIVCGATLLALLLRGNTALASNLSLLNEKRENRTLTSENSVERASNEGEAVDNANSFEQKLEDLKMNVMGYRKYSNKPVEGTYIDAGLNHYWPNSLNLFKRGDRGRVGKDKYVFPDRDSWFTYDVKTKPRPLSLWRPDLMCKMTYTQFWQHVHFDHVAKVKFNHNFRKIKITMKKLKNARDCNGQSQWLSIPYDPELYHHLVAHNVIIEHASRLDLAGSVFIAFLYCFWPVLASSVFYLLILKLHMFKLDKEVEQGIFRGTKVNRLDKSEVKLSFADIAGIDDIKEEISELVEFLKEPEKFFAFGAKSPSGVLLVGAPGTGKTLLAKALAGEAGVAFLSVSGTEFDQAYTGVGASKVRDCFNQARTAAPCILFIDEFDGLGASRSEGSDEESAHTINALLTELDGFEENSGVLIIAATNRPSTLDSALTRPGRFDRVIELPVPNAKGREEILRCHARKKRVSPDIDFTVVARSTDGFTGAMLMNVMNTAAIIAARNKAPAVFTGHLLEAIDHIEEEEFGLGDKDIEDDVPTSVRRRVAIYVAAQAMMASISPFSKHVGRIDCCRYGIADGEVVCYADAGFKEGGIVTRAHSEAELVVLMAGRCAERLFLGEANMTTRCSTDLEQATKLAHDMILQYGFGRRIGPVALSGEVGSFLGSHASAIADMGPQLSLLALKEVQQLLSGAEAKATYAIVKNWEALKVLIHELMTRSVIWGEEVRNLLKRNNCQYFPDPMVNGFEYQVMLPDL